jgi:hypothetical protein
VSEFHVADIRLGTQDSTGADIEQVYVRVKPLYAVYRTRNGVIVQYADDDGEAQRQRIAGSALNPLRRQIDGLIDGWRADPKRQAKAARYDARVAAALRVYLEGDPSSAHVNLEQVKQEIIEERTSVARFLYLIAAFVTASILFLLFLSFSQPWFHDHIYKFSAEAQPVWFAARAGAVGAFFSVTIGIRGRTILTNLRWQENLSDAVLRVVTGVIAAGALILVLRSGVISTFKIGEASFSVGQYSWNLAVIIAFLSGFSERLVPELLDKALPAAAAPPPRPAAAPAVRGGGQAGADQGAPPDASSRVVGPGLRGPVQPAAPSVEVAPAQVAARMYELWTQSGASGNARDHAPEAERQIGR